jgi:hypothetical protein
MPKVQYWKAIALLFPFAVFAQDESDIFQDQVKQCMNLVQNNWPTKRIEIAEERIKRELYRQMAMRCFQPACENPFTWVLFEVRYINGGTAEVNCSFKDGDEPRLDRYNEDNRFTPPR